MDVSVIGVIEHGSKDIVRRDKGYRTYSVLVDDT